MRIYRTIAIAVGGVSMLTLGAYAQSNPAAANQPATVNQRRQNQQERIANGIDSGQLTPGEAKSLESRQSNLNREIRDDRKANGGKLTQQEKQQVQHQESNLSKGIYQDKHNASAAHYGNGEIGQRRENQQDRIANGVRSGSLTPGEASRLENREQGINQQVRADRQANGGKLTRQDRRQVNRAQNRTSRAVYHQKHDRQHGF